MADSNEFDGDRYTQDSNLNVTGTLRVQGVPVTSTGGMFATTPPVVDGDLIAFQGTDGALTQNSGINAANVGDVKSPASATLNRIAIYGATKDQLEEGSATIAELGTVQTVSATVTNNALVRYSGTDGTKINDSSPGVATLDSNGDIVTPASVTQKTWVVTNFGKLDQIASASITNPTSGRKIYANLTNGDNFTIRRPDGTDIDVEAAAGGAAGSNTQVQYNKLGLFAGSAGLVFDDVTGNLTITGVMAAANITSGGVSVVPENRTITAGTGLTGGGDLSANRTINVVAGDPSISVAADSITVGTLQSDAQHGQLAGGLNHSVATAGTAGFLSASGFTKLGGIDTGAQNNTASNMGSGTGVFKQKSGSDLEFKSLTSGNGLGFVGNTDEVEINLPAISGTNRALLSDAAGTVYESSNLESFATASCWFLNDVSVPSNGSMAIGRFTNNANSNTTGSTLVGESTASNLGDDNNNITILGRGNLSAVIPNNVMSNINIFGHSSLADLVAGSNVITIGAVAGNSLASATNVTLMGVLAGNSMTSATDVHIYGRQFGPGGAVTDYVDLHDTLKMNILSNTVSIGGASNTKPILTQYSLRLDSITQIMRLNSITTITEGGLTLGVGDLWHNSTDAKYKVFENSEARELLSMAATGAEDTVVNFDANGFLKSTDVTARVNIGALRNLEISDKSLGASGSVLMVGNGTYNNFQSSVVIGASAAPAAADGTNTLVAIGRQCCENLVGGGSIASVVIGPGAGRAYLTGTNNVIMGSSAINGATVIGSSVVLGQLAGSAPDELTTSIIIGRNATGPAGIVGNYLSIGNSIQGDLSANTVTIGGTANIKPTNTTHSLELSSTTQVMGLNVLSQAQEDTAAAGISDGDFWYNSTLNKYRGRENGTLVTFTTS